MSRTVVEPRAVIPMAAPGPRRIIPSRPRTILVAEDEMLVALAVKSSLEELGYTVAGVARDGAQAVEVAEAHRPDLALLDVRMDGMDGLAAAEEIYGRLGIPVVILSAYGDEDYLHALVRRGVFGYLLKPATRDALRVTLAVAWDRYRREMELADRLRDRRLIERAKWQLVKVLRLDEAAAMRELQKRARASRRKIADVARELLEKHADEPEAPAEAEE